MTIVATKDTRNSAWASDKKSFAHRMMSKMGWKDGEGLGKDKQGTANSLRAVRKQEETLGIGATIDTLGSGGFAATRNNFTGILEKLKAEHSSKTDSIGKSEEKEKKKKKKKKSKSDNKSGMTLAQNKVVAGHAAKMRSAKDLSTKSKADLAAIFGTTEVDTMLSKSTSNKKKKRKRSKDSGERKKKSKKATNSNNTKEDVEIEGTAITASA